MKEVDWQTRLVKLYNGAEDGYGSKWVSEFQVGKPDLILSTLDFGPYFMELKCITLTPKQRQRATDILKPTGVKPRQIKEMKMMWDAGMTVVLGVIVNWKRPELYVLPYDREEHLFIMGAGIPWYGTQDQFDMKRVHRDVNRAINHG